jgi:hypothetical protein
MKRSERPRSSPRRGPYYIRSTQSVDPTKTRGRRYREPNVGPKRPRNLDRRRLRPPVGGLFHLSESTIRGSRKQNFLSGSRGINDGPQNLPPAQDPGAAVLARKGIHAYGADPPLSAARVRTGRVRAAPGINQARCRGAPAVFRDCGHSKPVVLRSAAGGFATAAPKTLRSPTRTTCCSARVMLV